MRIKIIFWLAITLLIFSQASFWQINLVLLVAVSWGLLRELRESMLMFFICGLLLDTASGHNLGAWTFVFVLVAVLVTAWRARFVPSVRSAGFATLLLFYIPIALISSIISKGAYNFLVSGSFNNAFDIKSYIGIVVASLIIFPLVAFVSSQSEGSSSSQLSLKGNI